MKNSEIIGADKTAHRVPKINTIICGDCIEVMQSIPDKSVDMILCDLPYGTTQNKWDSVIPFQPLWEQYKRVCRGAIVLTAQAPFDKKLYISNERMFKYEFIWEKTQAVGHLNAWKRPMSAHEHILVFCDGAAPYFPILTDKPIENIRPTTARTKKSDCYGNHKLDVHKCPPDKTMPKSVLKFANAQNTVHPTQKPVALFEYLIRTYTNEGDTVLDNCIGSGTTAIACINTGRNYIGIEKEEKYCKIAEERTSCAKKSAQENKEICHTSPNSANLPLFQQ